MPSDTQTVSSQLANSASEIRTGGTTNFVMPAINGRGQQPAGPAPQVQALNDRELLALRQATQFGRLQGNFEQADRNGLRGWARHEADTKTPVELHILDNGVLIGTVTAGNFREDLQTAGYDEGRHAFELLIPGGLSPLIDHVINVRRAFDGAELHGAPRVITACVTDETSRLSPLAARPPPGPAPAHPAKAKKPAGTVDLVTRDRITGWAHDNTQPNEPVALQVLDNGVLLGRLLANRFRPDLQTSGFGNGRHAFEFLIPGGLSPHLRHIIRVQHAADGTDLHGSPFLLETAQVFNDELKDYVAQAFNALSTREEFDAALAFTAGQMQHLLQQRADLDSQRHARRLTQEFHRRWGTQPEADTVEETAPAKILRALVVDVILPTLGQDAGSQAVRSHILALQSLGYEVTFATDNFAAQPAAGLAELEACGIFCCREPYYASIEDVLRRQAGCFDLIYLHRASIAFNYAAIARHHAPKARLIYSVADLHFLRLARQAQVEGRPELLPESRRLRMVEFFCAQMADAVITHSSVEAEILRKTLPPAKVFAVPWATLAARVTAPFALRRGVAFVANYRHGPNLDAAQWLIEVIMPLVWARAPGLECFLVGSHLPAALPCPPGVHAIGHVADLADVFNRVRLTVAPLRYGAGVKGKVLESFAAGLPCVMSPIAAEGIELPLALQALIGQDAAALAALICTLHEEAEPNLALSRAAAALADEQFGEERVREAMRAVVGG